MSGKEEKVILVDASDNQTGEMEKWEAHVKGVLHRAVSVVVFNSEGKMLLQQRAHSKYHTPGLWSNTCCSHPRPGESAEAAAHRRLQEEMGFFTPLQKILVFTYKVRFDNGLTEHEVDHLFIGTFNQDPVPNPEEVADIKWIAPDHLLADMKVHPEIYTAWFRIIMEKFEKEMPEHIHF